MHSSRSKNQEPHHHLPFPSPLAISSHHLLSPQSILITQTQSRVATHPRRDPQTGNVFSFHATLDAVSRPKTNGHFSQTLSKFQSLAEQDSRSKITRLLKERFAGDIYFWSLHFNLRIFVPRSVGDPGRFYSGAHHTWLTSCFDLE